MNGKQLKNSILQWAIQGKLVPQDPNDEPASVLLEKIRAEKARLVKEGKIKKDKNESIIYRGDDNSHYEKFTDGSVKCIDEEIPFEIPSSWVWVRMNELGLYRKGPFGSSLTKSMFVPKSVSTIKVYEQKNAIQKDYRLGDYYISQDKYKSMKSFIVQPNDIIVSCAGTIGETYVLPKEAPIGIINQALMRVCLYYLPLSEFWQMYFDYVLMKEAKMKGAGSAIKNIPPFEYLKAILVPLPPEAEQKKIVVRYFELLQKGTCFDKLRVDKEQLNSSIYAKLKQSFLQEAIQGKLVEQDPSDEPAVKLLERIREEKQELVKQGKLKKSELNDSVIFKGEDNKYYEKIGNETKDISDEIPFDIPENWIWSRMKNCCLMIFSGKSPSYSKSPTKCIIIGQQANQWNKIDMRYIKYGTDKYAESVKDFEFLQEGDVLLNSLGNGTLGRCGIFVNIKERILTDGHLFVFRTNNNITAKFILYFLKCNYWKINESADGSTNQTFLSLKTVSNYLLPLPPLDEQIRIVEKYELLLQKLQ